MHVASHLTFSVILQLNYISLGYFGAIILIYILTPPTTWLLSTFPPWWVLLCLLLELNCDSPGELCQNSLPAGGTRGQGHQTLLCCSTLAQENCWAQSLSCGTRRKGREMKLQGEAAQGMAGAEGFQREITNTKRNLVFSWAKNREASRDPKNEQMWQFMKEFTGICQRLNFVFLDFFFP